jgi:transposase
MKFGAALPTCAEGTGYPIGFASPDVLARIAERAAALGFDAVMANDHLSTPNSIRAAFDQPPNFYEPLITLAWCAARTERIKLMTGAIALPMREPVVLAKQVTTLDHCCHGRLIFGVAAGAHREEFEAAQPDLRHASRADMLDEGVQALRTWAPVGHTPVVAATGDRFGVNLISAVTAKGKLRFAAYEGNLNAGVFLDFCRRLLHDTPGPVFLILDGHPVHRSNAVKAFAASTGGRLRLCFLPGYSPELNPDEWVWKHVKHDRIGRAGVTGPDDLKAKALAALHRLQKLPHLVRSFFRDPNLRYITA